MSVSYSAQPVCVLTGATGLVGRYLLPALSTTQHVIAIVRRAALAPLPNVTYVVGDLTRDDVYAQLPVNAQSVVHLAQSPRFREFPDGVADVLAVNVASTERLTRYALHAGASHFVYASSGGVYASSHDPLREDAPLAAPAHAGWYQASKMAAEALVHAYRAHFVSVVLRPFFVYGRGQQRHMLLPRLADAIRAGTPVQLAGTDGMRLSTTSATDVASAIMASLQLTSPQTINVAGPRALTVREICTLLGDGIGREPTFQVGAEAAGDFVADLAQMTALLGAPQHEFSSTISTVLAS